MLQPVFSITEMCSNFLAVEKEQSWHQAWLTRANPLPLPPPCFFKIWSYSQWFSDSSKLPPREGRFSSIFYTSWEWGKLCSLFCVYGHRYSPIHSCLPVDKTDKWKPITELIETTTVCSLSSSLQDDTCTCDKEFRKRPSLPFPRLFCSEVTAAQLFKWTAAFLSLAMAHGTMVYEYN